MLNPSLRRQRSQVRILSGAPTNSPLETVNSPEEPCKTMQGTDGQLAYKARTGTYVYFAACDGFVKIGIAKNVEKRLRELQIGCPHKLDLIGLVEGGREIEAAYHKRFRKLRASGEWFRLAPPLTDEITRLVRIDLGLPAEGDLARHLRERMRPNPTQSEIP
jgi:hypothetical protein